MIRCRHYELNSSLLPPACVETQENGCKIFACVYASTSSTSSEDMLPSPPGDELEKITQCISRELYQKNNPSIETAACSALRNFCLVVSSSSSAPSSLPFKNEESRSTIVDTLVGAMRMHHEELAVLEQASGALWALCSTDQSGLLAFSSTKTSHNAMMDIALKSMEKIQKSIELQTNCIGILWSFFSVQIWIDQC